MSILIKGVEMPKEMRLFVVFPNGYTAIYDSNDAFVGGTKAVYVPPLSRNYCPNCGAELVTNRHQLEEDEG